MTLIVGTLKPNLIKEDMMKLNAIALMAVSVILGLAFSLWPVAAQDESSEESISPQEAQIILRETPVNVPELIEKVKRGVVVIQPIDVSSIAAAELQSIGSGFVIDKQGHIITNHHVGGEASVADIIFWDGTHERASLVATAPYYEVALLKLDDPDPAKLFPVTLGDSDTVKPGDLALAMGSPGSAEGENIDRSDPMEYWGLRSTATMRVITGRHTDLKFEVRWNTYGRRMSLKYALYLPYVFRTQVPLNAGNSGGPLFNRQGEVIAINTWAGFSPAAQQSNLGVPINCAKDFVVQVLEHGRHDIPWLGLHCIFPPNVNNAEAYVEFVETQRPEGLWVFDVAPESPAEMAGLRKGDQILMVNEGVPPRPEDFRVMVLSADIGEEFALSIRRGRREFTVHVYTVPKPTYVPDFSV